MMEPVIDIFSNLIIEIFIAGILFGLIIGVICYGIYKRFF